MYELQKAGKRIKELRETKGLSQTQMACELSKLITDRVLDKDNGKNTVSQLERGARGITMAYAFAYADIFNVSLDYVLGRSDDWRPEYKDVKRVTGLPDKAIDMLGWLSAPYDEPDDLQHIMDRFDAIEAFGEKLNAGVITRGFPGNVTDDELEVYKEFLQNETNKKNLNAISLLLSSYKGLEVINSMALFFEVSPDDEILRKDKKTGVYTTLGEEMLRAMYAQQTVMVMKELLDEEVTHGKRN